MSSLFKELCDKYRVKQIHSSLYHPQSNSCVEIFHRTLNATILKTMDNKLTWPNQIDFILFHLRNIPNRVTGISSWKFVNGRTMSHLLDTLKEY